MIIRFCGWTFIGVAATPFADSYRTFHPAPCGAPCPRSGTCRRTGVLRLLLASRAGATSHTSSASKDREVGRLARHDRTAVTVPRAPAIRRGLPRQRRDDVGPTAMSRLRQRRRRAPSRARASRAAPGPAAAPLLCGHVGRVVGGDRVDRPVSESPARISNALSSAWFAAAGSPCTTRSVGTRVDSSVRLKWCGVASAVTASPSAFAAPHQLDAPRRRQVQEVQLPTPVRAHQLDVPVHHQLLGDSTGHPGRPEPAAAGIPRA